MFLQSSNRQNSFLKDIRSIKLKKKALNVQKKVSKFIYIILQNEFIKGHHLIKKMKIKDQVLNMENK